MLWALLLEPGKDTSCLVLDGALRFADLLGWDPEGGEAASCAPAPRPW